MTEASSTSWFKVQRSEETRELLGDPCTFALLTLIAYRAQRTAVFNRHGLLPGQALLGDYEASGLSEQQYRTAKTKLQKWKFATFKATNKGTIATLIGTRVFDINCEPINERINNPATNEPRTSNEPATTTNNVNKEKNERRGIGLPPVFKPSEAIKFEKELARIVRELEKLGRLSDHDRGSKSHARFFELTERQADLRKLLGVKA